MYSSIPYFSVVDYGWSAAGTWRLEQKVPRIGWPMGHWICRENYYVQGNDQIDLYCVIPSSNCFAMFPYQRLPVAALVSDQSQRVDSFSITTLRQSPEKSDPNWVVA